MKRMDELLSRCGQVRLISFVTFFFGQVLGMAQITPTQAQSGLQRSFLDTPFFTNAPEVRAWVSNLWQEPIERDTIPVLSTDAALRQPGTYWSLQKSNQPPWPARLFPELPVYALDNRHYVVDDRAVDYASLHALQALEAEANGGEMTIMESGAYDYGDTTNLWLEIPEGGVASNVVDVILHNTSEGQSYALLTKTDLSLPFWTGELTITGAVGDATSTQLQQNDRTNLFIWARSGVASTITILTQPMSQEIVEGDIITFSVVATGNGPLSYQWLHWGTNLPGATGSQLTIQEAWYYNRGEYAVVVADQVGSALSETATLTVWANPGTAPFYLTLYGDRQDYAFREGFTYEINSTVNLFGTTTLKGGTVLKFDGHRNDSTLRVFGDLVCDTGPYRPCVLTSVDDDSIGVHLEWTIVWSYLPLQPYPGAAPYLDLTAATPAQLDGLRVRYADVGIAMPSVGTLEVWNSQFFHCNNSITNGFGGHVSLHNVLFAGCSSVVTAGSNHFSIAAEHVTSQATNFWTGLVEPDFLAVTNSLHLGAFAPSSNQFLDHLVIDPAASNFETNGAGRYYLAKDSAFHRAGTTNINTALRAAFQARTTYAPVGFAPFTEVSGVMSLLPQVPRYTNGPPCLGYHYDLMDYTVGRVVLIGGTLSLLPGTVVGMREEYYPAANLWTGFGFDVEENSKLISCGLPDQPVILTDAHLVQEQYMRYCFATVRPDFWPGEQAITPPSLDFRFTHSYVSPGWYHVWAGYDEDLLYIISACALVNWNMQDCALYGGKVSLGAPSIALFGMEYIFGSGLVTWRNNLFHEANINVYPSFYWNNGITNCDLRLVAEQNLFRNSQSLQLVPNPTSMGNWRLSDNHFESVQFAQYTNAPLDFDYNAYWPKRAIEQVWLNHSNRLKPSSSTNGLSGQHDVVAVGTPPYQSGPYGKHYLAMANPLYHAGSQSFEQAGLSQYTTRADQITEGQELSGHAVNIGLHYVATSNVNSRLPKDGDGDGVPDYVEDANGDDAVDGNETDLALVMTDGTTVDATNSVYDNADLDGDGLVGRIEKALTTNPLLADNSLRLTQVAFDEEWGIASFELPLPYNVLTNVGVLNLRRDGVCVTLEELQRATNGNCLLRFNETYEPAGSHYLQAQITVNTGQMAFDSILSGVGTIQPYYSSNIVQLFTAGSMFDDGGAYLDAKLFMQSADYTIELYDPSTAPATLIKTITNSTSSGMIQEDWNVMLADNVTPFTNQTVHAVFNARAVAGTNAPVKKAKKVLTQAKDSLSEAGPNIAVAYLYTPTNGDMVLAYGQGGQVWNGMQRVVDVLIKDAWTWEVYESTFNRYLPDSFGEYPGYITRRTRTTNDPPNLFSITENLFPALTNKPNRQFYCYAHGTGSRLENAANTVFMEAAEVGKLLGNVVTGTNLVAQHAYRFVFLDGCSTASKRDWANAFGIYPFNDPAAFRNRVGQQAIVGWATEVASWMAGAQDPLADVDIAKAYTQTLADFYSDWMNKVPLAQCIANASVPRFGKAPFPVPGNEVCQITGPGFAYINTNLLTSKIYVTGYSGLRVDGVDSSRNNEYAPPK